MVNTQIWRENYRAANYELSRFRCPFPPLLSTCKIPRIHRVHELLSIFLQLFSSLWFTIISFSEYTDFLGVDKFSCIGKVSIATSDVTIAFSRPSFHWILYSIVLILCQWPRDFRQNFTPNLITDKPW